MDICAIDWRAVTPLFASILAAGTALYISNKWSKQKGSEVVASEAKEIIYKLKDIQRFFSTYNETIRDDNCDEIINEYKLLHSELVHKIDFLFKSIENKSDKRKLLEFVLALQIDSILRTKRIINKTKKGEEINDIFKMMAENFNNNQVNIIPILMKYALYRVSIG